MEQFAALEPVVILMSLQSMVPPAPVLTGGSTDAQSQLRVLCVDCSQNAAKQQLDLNQARR
ncbi:hypothetical protein [Bradyrhizobium liaoningense]